jgi:hypothetical protein
MCVYAILDGPFFTLTKLSSIKFFIGYFKKIYPNFFFFLWYNTKMLSQCLIKYGYFFFSKFILTERYQIS